MSNPTTLVWFRLDLRVSDQPALAAALQRGGPVVPVFIWDPEGEGAWAPGGASRSWLHHSLSSLARDLEAKGLTLVLRKGRSLEVLQELVNESHADAVYWNRRYEPAVIARDKTIKETLGSRGVEAKSFSGSLLFEPHTIKNKQGGPFQVFTPYWKHCLTLPIPAPVKMPGGSWKGVARPLRSEALESWGLLPALGWDAGFYKAWKPGESGALERLRSFFKKRVEDYTDGRDFPSRGAISGLSPHLHFGEISPSLIWQEARKLSGDTGVFPSSSGLQKFLTEVGWREFAFHLLFHFPHTPEQPLRPDFARFAWASDPKGKALRSWQKGLTGYPIVDAGMRELWATGFMHNRVRMVVASFLVKHLRLPWQQGAAWFWDTLIDADLASNTLGWQWSAGCGADAAPYFRIFAPVLQGEKFDGAGYYVRKWVPELARLPDAWLHKPWEAPSEVLENAGIQLGTTYPAPVVNHAKAREEALAAYKKLTGKSEE